MGSGASELVSNWEQNMLYTKKLQFYAEKEYLNLFYARAHQLTFSMVNRFCQLSKTQLLFPVISVHNHAGWNTKQS